MHIKAFLLVFLTLTLATRSTQAFVDGIDVSRWQGTINWNNVKADGIDFAFVKATEGVDFVDVKFHANMQGAIAAGVYIGPYHFARLDSLNGVPFTSYDGSPFAPGSAPYLDAVSEANDFLDAIMPYYDTGLHLPPVADVERLPDFNSTFLEREFISNWVQLFSDTVNNSLGRRPIIYTSKFGANTRYTPAVASSHDLWLAWWKNSTSNPPVTSDTPAWSPWDFWQWTATGSVNGVGGNVDRDVFDGTLQQLEELLIDTGPANPSDFDQDGDVDGQDLAQWTDDYGLNPDSDADNDDDSDGSDFLAWQRNLTSSATAASQSVPEPSTALLLAFGLAVLCGAKTARKKSTRPLNGRTK